MTSRVTRLQYPRDPVASSSNSSSQHGRSEKARPLGFGCVCIGIWLAVFRSIHLFVCINPKSPVPQLTAHRPWVHHRAWALTRRYLLRRLRACGQMFSIYVRPENGTFGGPFEFCRVLLPRQNDMSQAENLSTKLRTLSYDHERLMNMHRTSKEKLESTEKEVSLFKSRLA